MYSKPVFFPCIEIDLQNESSWTSVIGEAFEIVPQLEELDLSWNSNIGGKLSLLTKKLPKGCKIKLLKMTDCNLTAKDGESLGKCIHIARLNNWLHKNVTHLTQMMAVFRSVLIESYLFHASHYTSIYRTVLIFNALPSKEECFSS